MRLIDAALGKTFGRLTLIHRVKTPKVLCRCECGVEKEINAYNILKGAVTSCGCMQRESLRARNTKHGLSDTGAYKSWCAMWTRCTNPKGQYYGMGRTPPESWRDFEQFLKDMGPRPEGYSLERKDNDRPYGPRNCIWIPQADQALNRRTTIRVVINGEVLSLKAAAKRANVPYTTVIHRVMKQHWAIADALGIQVEATLTGEEKRHAR